MSKYQIKLTPVDSYFFGGEKHSKNPTKKNQLEMDYFVRSELYPQQTALLGVLRYYILLKNDCLSPVKNGKSSTADGLIGTSSFQYGYKDDKGNTEQNFSKIKTILPLYFISMEHEIENKYIIAPFDNGVDKKNDFQLVNEFGNYKLEGYEAKTGYSPCLINLQDNSRVKFFKNKDSEKDNNYVFIIQTTVGNKKGGKGKAEDDGFFKQNMCKLNKDWCFAFEAEIDDLELNKDRQLLSFGAEKQLFLFEIKKIESETNLYINAVPRSKPAIYCISDCFIDERIWKEVVFAVNSNISFRNLQSSNRSANYSSFSKGYNRSKRYNLMKRGSILFFEDECKLNQALSLLKNANAENIGFNKIQIIK